MLIRVIAVDPDPREDPKRDSNDLLTFHVPENSRQAELLTELLTNARIEYVILDPSNKVYQKKLKNRRRRR